MLSQTMIITNSAVED